MKRAGSESQFEGVRAWPPRKAILRTFAADLVAYHLKSAGCSLKREDVRIDIKDAVRAGKIDGFELAADTFEWLKFARWATNQWSGFLPEFEQAIEANTLSAQATLTLGAATLRSQADGTSTPESEVRLEVKALSSRLGAAGRREEELNAAVQELTAKLEAAQPAIAAAAKRKADGEESGPLGGRPPKNPGKRGKAS